MSVLVPREVSAANGATRWQGADGASYATREEAAASFGEKPIDHLPVSPPSRPIWKRVAEALFLLAVGLGGLWIGYRLAIRWDQLTWLQAAFTVLFPLGAVTALVEAGSGILAILKEEDEAHAAKRASEMIDRGFSLAGRLIWTALGIGAAIGAIFLLRAIGSEVFEGVDKGTAIIIVLLVGILFALLQIANRPQTR